MRRNGSPLFFSSRHGRSIRFFPLGLRRRCRRYRCGKNRNHKKSERRGDARYKLYGYGKQTRRIALPHCRYSRDERVSACARRAAGIEKERHRKSSGAVFDGAAVRQRKGTRKHFIRTCGCGAFDRAKGRVRFARPSSGLLILLIINKLKRSALSTMTAAATRPPCRKGSAFDGAFTPSAYARAERCRRQTPERA